MDYDEVDIQAVRFLTSDGGTILSSLFPEISCEMPPGTFTSGSRSFCRVSLQVTNTDQSMVRQFMGNDAFVSPLILMEPLRRKFHAAPVIRLPLPGFGLHKIDPKSVRVLISVTGSSECNDWQDITSVVGESAVAKAAESGVILLCNVIVSGRFAVVCCDNSIMDVAETMSEMMTSRLDKSDTADQPHLDLLHAAHGGDLTALRACLASEGMDINFTNKSGQSALHLACSAGHQAIVQELLKAKADMTLISQKGNAAIHLACFHGYKEIVELLLDNGCDVNIPSKHSCFPPLYAAILETHCEVVEVLLSRGASVTWSSPDGLSLLLVAVFTTYDREKTIAILQLLLEKLDITKLEISPELKDKGFSYHGEALLHSVCTRQAAKDLIGPVRLKLANQSASLLQDDMATCEKEDGDFRKLLTACKEGNMDEIILFLENGELINRLTKGCVSCLHCACASGHMDIVEKLLKAGANVNTLTQYGFSCLYIASSAGFTDVVKMLLKAGANTDTLTHMGLTSSDIATEMGYMNIVAIIKDYMIRNEYMKTSRKSINTTEKTGKVKDKDDMAVKKCCALI
ncbi:ankyrin-3-like [Dreissena polymorpha]|uniref:ZU5 domain-containing protein n=1 Tax=Dreissena polymorpha TaxID=45954 RepID=A0A9D4RDF7_DREPO|nr:ankyrin-3-like [Dreissena polymorpha]XP_052263641.1 ankyrin-3-like [Dreissena polymorpha]XP_052263642.1 ankyrin-3-like [Dreissena polymorpha]KAH3864406.1 hypothetical protein DPMN_027423 [Dreissena polymorpha]